jgi:tRNA-specific 2-thiouridylase
MSGGTDSSVAAILLLEKSYEVIGITFRFWEEGENEHLDDAVKLAEKLHIKHIIYDARNIFREKVIKYFINEYLIGKTPFPCAVCNNELKWNLILQEADKLDCQYVAMGHYTNIVSENGKFFISEGKDKEKDQSFFLWGLKQEQLARIVFPLGTFTKQETREFAEKRGFPDIARKKDSLGVCFCPGDYRSFLKKELKNAGKYIYPGNFLDETGTVIGRHAGYPMYTIGQRRGLGIHLNRAVFVKEINPARNEIVLAPLKSLYKTSFFVKDYNLVDRNLFSNDFDTIIRIRYRKQTNLGKITIIDANLLQVTLLEPLESIASGQAAVFYRCEKVLGGGFIA